MCRARTAGFTINYFGFATDSAGHSAVTALQQSQLTQKNAYF